MNRLSSLSLGIFVFIAVGTVAGHGGHSRGVYGRGRVVASSGVSVPTLLVTSPLSGAVGVAADTSIVFSFQGSESQVSLASVQVSVDGVSAVINGAIQAAFNGSGASIVQVGNDVQVVLKPTVELDWGNVTDVAVQATSPGGTLNASYSFTTWAPTKALEFNGSDEYLESSVDSAEFDAVEKGTWVADVYLPYSLSTSRAILAKGNLSSDTQWALIVTGSPTPAIRLHVSNAVTSEAEYGTTISLPNDQWTRVVAVYDGTQGTAADRIKLWAHPYDTAQHTTSGTPQPTMNSGTVGTLRVGRVSGSNSSYLPGRIQSAAYWVNKAATLSEVLAILADTKPKNPSSVSTALGKPIHLWLMGNDASDDPATLINDRGAGPGLMNLVPQNMAAGNLMTDAPKSSVQATDTTALTRHTWHYAWDSKDAVPGATWPVVAGNAVLRARGNAATANVSTTGLNAGSLGLGASRLNKAITMPDTSSGFSSHPASDLTQSAVVMYVPSIASSGLTARFLVYWGANVAATRNLARYLLSTTKYVNFTRVSSTATLRINIRDDADGATENFDVAIPVNTWALIDFALRPGQGAGGNARTLVRVNGVESSKDYASNLNADLGPANIGVAVDYTGITGGYTDPFVWGSFKFSALSHGTNQTDASNLGIEDVRLMIMGDSIMRGFGSTDGDGVRSILATTFAGTPLVNVNSVANAVSFLGPVDDGSIDHWAADGRVIDYFTTNLSTNIGIGGSYRPTVAVLAVGMNDCRNNGATYNTVTTPAALQALLETLRTEEPTALVAFSNVIDANGDPTTQANIDDLNAQLPAIVAAQRLLGQHVLLVDANAALTAPDYSDVYHPNDAGYAKLAAAITTTIRALYLESRDGQ